MEYLIKKSENYKNQIITLKNVLIKLKQEPDLWKTINKGGADQYLGGPAGMRYIDEALRRIEELEEQFKKYRDKLNEK